MALFHRVSRLFKADFNAVLDHIEEPEQLLKQAIRDMEDDLAVTRQHIASALNEQSALRARRQEVVTSAAPFEEQLDLCFRSGKDDLARGIIRRKLEAESLVKRLDGKLDTNARFLDQQRKLLDENHATLESLRQKAELIVCRAPADDRGSDFDDVAGMVRELRVGDDEVEIAFLREKAARSGS
jgi:phage shock protein A